MPGHQGRAGGDDAPLQPDECVSLCSDAPEGLPLPVNSVPSGSCRRGDVGRQHEEHQADVSLGYGT